MHFSVITINYNNCEGLQRTIDSVIGQTFNNFEFIVIDGGSTDGSVDIIKKNAASITYWSSERDNGIYHAMNKGVAQAHGDYCIFMNSGDCFYNQKVLERLAEYDIKEDIIIGKLISKESGVSLFTPPKRKMSLYYLYSGTVPHQSSFIKTELLRHYPYDESLKIVSDWKFFVQTIILANCSIKYVDENVAVFDLEGVSTLNPERMWKEKENVLSTMFPLRVLEDYQVMKASECLTLSLTSELRKHYRVDVFLFKLGKLILKYIKE